VRTSGQNTDSLAYGPLTESKSFNGLIISDSTYFHEDTLKQSVHFNDSLNVKNKKNTLVKELQHLIINSSDKKGNKDKQPAESSFLPYNNSIIKSIRFKQVDVFGQSVTDTVGKDVNWLERQGNKLHVNTNKKILMNSLLFKTGEPLDALVVADNERILRDLPYIEDVRILVYPDTPNADTVDVVIVVKDVWPIGFGINISDINSGDFGIWNKSIFGFGHENQHNIFWNLDGKNLLGYEGIYKISNISGSFIAGDFRYMKKDVTESYRIGLQRKFFTPNIKYAGGVIIEYKDTRTSIELLDTIMEDEPVQYNLYDLWLGRAFLIPNTGNLLTNSRTNIMLAGKILRKTYYLKPSTTESSLYEFHDKTIILGTAALTRQGYFRSNLIYSFGRTEDIPFGLLLQVIAGMEFGDFHNRPYIGTRIAHGTYLWRLGYLYNRIEIGGFYFRNAFEQGVLGITSKYFTHIINSGRFNYRFFTNINYKIGIRRFDDEFISIENKNGITGLKSELLKGTQKFTVNMEMNAFSPFYLYGFRFVFFGSVDLGFIGPDNKMIFSNNLYSGIGIGVRLRNERLVFNTFQIKLTYYPAAPAGADREYINLSGEPKLRPNDFYITEPKIIEF
jgi:hypothetical protein